MPRARELVERLRSLSVPEIADACTVLLGGHHADAMAEQTMLREAYPELAADFDEAGARARRRLAPLIGPALEWSPYYEVVAGARRVLWARYSDLEVVAIKCTALRLGDMATNRRAQRCLRLRANLTAF